MARIVFFFTVLFAFAAVAQEFPTHPVTIIVPFSAGGPTDTIARIMAQRMTKALGQNVLVENTTGAGGTIGVGRVARAAPDGYTLGIGHIGTHVVNGAIYELPYDLQKDFEPVAMIASNPQIIVSKLAVPARDLKELIAWVKANQDKVSLATGGAGTPAHVSGKLKAAIRESLLDADGPRRLAELGQEIPSREQQAPAALGARHKAEIDKWWPLIKAAGIKAE